MRKVTDFIVQKHKFILVLFIFLAIISLVLMQKVKINNDLSEYLPAASETKKGNDIMNQEFDPINSSTLYIMFINLEDKEDTLKYLENIKYVKSVSYDSSSDYNNGKYTLYILNADYNSNSDEAKSIYKDVNKHFKKYNYKLDGSIANSNKQVLPTWIVALAIGSAVIILLIMSDNLVEPFLILYSVGIAVFLNKGSNIMFKNVSNVTDGIVGVLQMALSMDYSIILINRFKQEKKHFKDNIDAMKEALYKSVGAISSSSLTTIVGLLCLVFMTFTLGRDLGVVLAKGVLLSLVSIFFCLPGLLLMFDKLINKTKKRILEPKFNILSKVTYSLRYIFLVLMVFLFIISSILKGNLKYLYTQEEVNKIEQVFGVDNQMALIYKNRDEEYISKYCTKLEQNKDANRVLCYGNTINKKLKYDEVKDHVSDLGEDISDVDDYLLKIIYYNYYNKDNNEKMTFEEFVKFILNDINNNEDLKSRVEENKDSIEKLKYFTYKDEIYKERTAKELSDIFGINKKDVEMLIAYYNSIYNNNAKITLNEFVKFINTNILNDNAYSSYISNDNRNKLKLLTKYVDKNKINKKMNSKEMSEYFDLDKNLVDNLYIYYLSNSNISTKISIKDFINFTLNYVVKDKTYSKYFDKESINNLKMLKNFTDKKYINTKVGSKELSNTFNIEEDKVKELLYLYYSKYDSNDSYTILELIDHITYIKNNTNYLDNIDYSEIINSSDYMNISFDKDNLYKYFDKELVDSIYETFNLNDNYKLSISDILTITSKYIDSDKLNEYKEYIKENINLDKNIINNLHNYIDQDTLDRINTYVSSIKDKINNNSKKYTSSELASLLRIDKSITNNIYALIKLTSGNTDDWKLSRLEFVNHLLNNKKYLDNNTISKLNILKKVMDSTNSNTKYNYNGIATILGIDNSKVKSIYSIYTYKKTGFNIKPVDIVKFILNHKDDDMLKPYLNSNYLSKLQLVNKIFTSVNNNTKYDYNGISELLGIDSSKTKLIYGIYNLKRGFNHVSIYKLVNFILDDVLNSEYSNKFSTNDIKKIKTINTIMNSSINNIKYTSDELFLILSELSDELDSNTVELLYIYYGSSKDYNNSYRLTLEELVNYLHDDILRDSRFSEFITDETKDKINKGYDKLNDAHDMLVGKNYSRMVILTKTGVETDSAFKFVEKTRSDLKNTKDTYLIGNSPMAYEISKSFNSEFNFITIVTMISIFVVVAFTFKSLISPLIITLIIQSSVFITMGILSFTGEPVSFIAVLVVQSILMGATIDYGIVYTTYYLENRTKYDSKESMLKAYRKSSHTIFTSGCILIMVTLMIGLFAKDVVSKICLTLSVGTSTSVILIIFILPAVMSALDKLIVRRQKNIK